MGTCETCGNRYDKAFEVVMDGERHVFDSFECGEGAFYCCAHCAQEAGIAGLADRA